MSDDDKLTCGDYGGTTKSGSPCGQVISKPGRCHRHKPDVHVERDDGHQVTDLSRRFVETCCYGGIDEAEVAGVLGISIPQLFELYEDQINQARTRANAKVVQTAFQMATSGKNKTMTIFWLKSRLGWSDKGPKKTEEQQRQALIKKIESRLDVAEARSQEQEFVLGD